MPNLDTAFSALSDPTRRAILARLALGETTVMTLSVGEDVLAVSITWLATTHPYLAASIVAVMLAATILVVRWIVRALKALFRGAEQAIAK